MVLFSSFRVERVYDIILLLFEDVVFELQVFSKFLQNI